MRFVRLVVAILAILTLVHQHVYGQATWKGYQYQSRVCSDSNCRMCNSIQRQLNAQRSRTYVQPRQVVEYVQPQVVVTEADSKRDFLAVTELVPTSDADLNWLLHSVHVPKDAVFYELGCGDARVLDAVEKRFRCQIVGVELNNETASKARKRIGRRGRIIAGNVLHQSYDDATHVYMYLYPELMEKACKMLPKGTVVVSYLHQIPGANNVSLGKFYLAVM